ncbi:hypothetical protein R3P38DRAFT_3202580 [Favolaschia claudopus]|uniref:Uncharacterized protein n=1 Tax=Favolaschia claudopus TaxID=2862362 RepID=A0AAW0AU83_9AGAR
MFDLMALLRRAANNDVRIALGLRIGSFGCIGLLGCIGHKRNDKKRVHRSSPARPLPTGAALGGGYSTYSSCSTLLLHRSASVRSLVPATRLLAPSFVPATRSRAFAPPARSFDPPLFSLTLTPYIAYPSALPALLDALPAATPRSFARRPPCPRSTFVPYTVLAGVAIPSVRDHSTPYLSLAHAYSRACAHPRSPSRVRSTPSDANTRRRLAFVLTPIRPQSSFSCVRINSRPPSFAVALDAHPALDSGSTHAHPRAFDPNDAVPLPRLLHFPIRFPLHPLSTSPTTHPIPPTLSVSPPPFISAREPRRSTPSDTNAHATHLAHHAALYALAHVCLPHPASVRWRACAARFAFVPPTPPTSWPLPVSAADSCPPPYHPNHTVAPLRGEPSPDPHPHRDTRVISATRCHTPAHVSLSAHPRASPPPTPPLFRIYRRPRSRAHTRTHATCPQASHPTCTFAFAFTPAPRQAHGGASPPHPLASTPPPAAFPHPPSATTARVCRRFPAPTTRVTTAHLHIPPPHSCPPFTAAFAHAAVSHTDTHARGPHRHH